jgi:hypothetical protein
MRLLLGEDEGESGVGRRLIAVGFDLASFVQRICLGLLSASGGGPVRLARPSAASHGQRNPLLARQRNGAASSGAAQISMKTEHEEDV